jgi:hypothetical protein
MIVEAPISSQHLEFRIETLFHNIFVQSDADGGAMSGHPA